MATPTLIELGERVQPVYAVPRDDVAGDLLIPAMAASDEVRCMAGFFSSRSFAHLAPGLASFINDSNGKMLLLVSPKLDDEHRNTIEFVAQNRDEVMRIMTPLLLTTDGIEVSAVVKHTIECFAFLLATERLTLRVVLMPQGMFHAKVWIFRGGNARLVVHGSSNPTEPGLLHNVEHINVERDWVESKRADYYRYMFDAYWHGEDASSVTIDFDQAAQLFRKFLPESTPTVEDFWNAWDQDAQAGLVPAHGVNRVGSVKSKSRLRIPGDLEWHSGPFAHQGQAVDAWERQNGRGIIAVATGGGKTIISLICATRLQERMGKLLLVVSAPYKPLLEQWNSEIQYFGLVPWQANEVDASGRRKRMDQVVQSLQLEQSTTEAIIVSNDMLKSELLREMLERVPRDITTMLIADEAHNLGTKTFLSDPPERFDYRLGLSATHVRQYDQDGTEGLLRFFGDPVFEFDLESAIRAGCLCRYRYYLHEVMLTQEESERWEEITDELRAKHFLNYSDDEGQAMPDYIRLLLIKRRAIVENAQAKIEKLHELLSSEPRKELKHTLVYTSAKETQETKQIVLVNRLLNDLGIDSRQLTSKETGSGDSAEILSAFANGTYQVLTAMKVLDEGVNIPDARTAYLLASSTVKREWVQRRGRILRKAPKKDMASIHDFIAVPPDTNSTGGKDMLRGELLRAREFAKLSENSAETWAQLAKYSD